MTTENKEPMQFTLALIKSRAIEQGHADNIRHEIGKLHGAKVIAEVYGETHKAAFEQLYEEHYGRPYYDGLIESVTEPHAAQVFVMQGPDVIKRWRDKLGATNPSNAFPGTIRHSYGLNMPHNAGHGSDSPESALREIAIFFPQLDLSGMELASITEEAGIAA
jgi:nucleoside-diphosphate kinase